MVYLRRRTDYPERIRLYDPTHMMSLADLVVVGVKTLTIDSWHSLEKEFTKFIYMNPLKVIIPNCQSC